MALSCALRSVGVLETSGLLGGAPRVKPRRRRGRRRLLAATLVLLVVLVARALLVRDDDDAALEPAARPRSVEWLRQHHGNWLVDEVEHYYYSWKAPSKGGPQLRRLPSVGIAARPGAGAGQASPRRVAAADRARLRAPAAR